MSKLPTLHVFGSSTVFNFTEESGIGDSKLSWPYLLANELGYSLNVYAKPAVCNSFIGRQIIQNLDNIQKDDMVIVLWGHWSRVMFGMDKDTMKSMDIESDSLLYPSHSNDDDLVWVRSKGPPKKWISIPSLNNNYGRPYYDYYFKNYYFDQHRHLEDMENILLIKLLLEKNDINYMFTAHDTTFLNKNYSESKKTLSMITDANWILPNNMGRIEISNMNEWHISKDDQHFSIDGHKQIAKLLENEIKNTIRL
jgi:hypothetical protein